MRKFLKVILPILVLAAGAAAAVTLIRTRPRAARTPPRAAATLVEVITASKGSEQVVVEAMGTVVPAKAVVVQPQVTGRIVEQSPKLLPGGLFKKDEVIARIDPRDYELAVQQQKAAVQRATFELKVEEGRQVVAKREWNLLESDLAESEAGRALALREPQLETAKAALAAARSGLEQATLSLERTTIRAPFNALVKEEFIDLGQLVAPQTRLATLIGTDEYWVQVSIPMDRLQWVAIPGINADAGATAEVLHAVGPEMALERAGRVVRLLGDLDPVGRMARVLVAVDDPLGLAAESNDGAMPLLIGAYVRVLIEGPVLDDVVVVPRRALREGDRVWVMNADDRLEIREANIVWRREDDVILRESVEEGEQIIVSSIVTPVPGLTLRLEDDGTHLTVPPAIDQPPLAATEVETEVDE
jgi:RND family efflux transporter MFP subunit